MKTCNKCKHDKPTDGFHKDTNKKDGLCTICKICKIENSKAWYKNNTDRAKDLGKKSYERIKSDPKRYSNRLSYAKKWREKNLDKHAAKESKRRARKLSATPVWLSRCHNAHIKRIFKLSKLMTEITGQPHEVDHIVPLQGRSICGLHVPWNLRVISASDNRSKGNRL